MRDDSPRGMFARLRLDGFLLSLVAALALAFIVPEFGATGGPLQPAVTTKLVVALVFFLHGVRLSRTALRQGVGNIKLHGLIQATTFIAFPLVGLVLLSALSLASTPRLDVWLPGVLLLCALPSTISSAVVLTAASRGDVGAAVFNAALSNLAAAFLTPLWVMLLMGGATHQVQLGQTLLSLTALLLAPFFFGQLLQPYLLAYANRYHKALSWLERALIVALVFTAFCDFFLEPSQLPSWVAALEVFVWCVFLLTIAKLGLWWASKALGLSYAARICALFCGSHKSLATGIPLAQVMFGSGAHLGPLLVPLLIYHPLQLMVGGWLVERLKQRQPSK